MRQVSSGSSATRSSMPIRIASCLAAQQVAEAARLRPRDPFALAGQSRRLAVEALRDLERHQRTVLGHAKKEPGVERGPLPSRAPPVATCTARVPEHRDAFAGDARDRGLPPPRPRARCRRRRAHWRRAASCLDARKARASRTPWRPAPPRPPAPAPRLPHADAPPGCVQPRPTTRSSFDTITQPTAGLGAVRPSARSASARAWRMWWRSVICISYLPLVGRSKNSGASATGFFGWGNGASERPPPEKTLRVFRPSPTRGR